MQTPAIFNVTNTAQNSAPTAKQADAGSSDIQFNQMLSRQIADRNNAKAAERTQQNQNQNKASEANKSNKNNDTEKSGNASPSQANVKNTDGNAPAKPAAADANSGKVDEKAKTEDPKDAPEASDTTATPASAELLALVANLTQPVAKPTVAAATDASVQAIDTGRAAVVSQDQPGQDLATNAAVNAAIAGGSDNAPKDGTIKPDGQFDALVDQAGKLPLPSDMPVNAKKQEIATPLTTTTASALQESAKPKESRGVPLVPTAAVPNQNTATTQDLRSGKTAPTTEPGLATAKANDALVSRQDTAKAQIDFSAAPTAKEIVTPHATATAASFDLAAAKALDKGAEPTATALPAIQQAAFNIAELSNTRTTEKLTPPVGTPAWDQAVGQKIVWMVAGGQQTASLTLNPPDLGPMQIVLSVNNSHADTTFIAAQPEVRQALEAALPKLREMMGDAGIQMGQTTVSAGMPNNQQQNNFAGEQQRQAAGRFEQSNDTVETTIRTTRSGATTGGTGLVDTFA